MGDVVNRGIGPRGYGSHILVTESKPGYVKVLKIEDDGKQFYLRPDSIWVQYHGGPDSPLLDPLPMEHFLHLSKPIETDAP